jgi:hypothetical protein
MYSFYLNFSKRGWAILFFAIFSSICALHVFGQNELSRKYVRIEKKTLNLHAVLTSIQSQTGISFCFVDDGVSNVTITFSRKIQHIRVDSLLDMFCPLANIEYVYKHNQIILRRKHGSHTEKPKTRNSLPAAQSPKELAAVKNPAVPSQKPVSRDKSQASAVKEIVRYDTIVKVVVDTVYLTRYDTLRLVVRDTILREIRVPVIKRVESEWKVSVGAFYAPEFPVWNKLSSAGTASSASDSMAQHNKLQLSWTVGANVFISKKRWFGSIGLSYSNLNSQIEYHTPAIDIKSTPSWSVFYKDVRTYGVIEEYTEEPSKIVVQVWDSITVSVKDSSLQTNYDTSYIYQKNSQTNHYRYIEIPLSVGYSFYKTDRLSVYGTLGCSFGILYGASGKHYLPSGLVTETDVTQLSALRFRGTGGLGIDWSFGKSFSLWGECSAIYNGFSMYSEKVNYADKQLWASARFGIRYHLK